MEARIITKEIQVVENVPVKKEVETIVSVPMTKEVETMESQTFTKQMEVIEQVPVMKQVTVTQPVHVKKPVEFVEPIITTGTVTREMRSGAIVSKEVARNVGPVSIMRTEGQDLSYESNNAKPLSDKELAMRKIDKKVEEMCRDFRRLKHHRDCELNNCWKM